MHRLLSLKGWVTYQSREDFNHFYPSRHVIRENNAVKYWMGQCSTHIVKRQSKISNSSGQWFCMASGSLPVAKTGQFVCAHPSCAAVEGPCPHSHRALTQQWCWPDVI